VAPPAGAVITVAVPSLMRLRSGIVNVSFELSVAAFGKTGCRGAGTSGTFCGAA